MYKLTSELILYRDLEEKSILSELSGVFYDFDNKCDKVFLKNRVNDILRRVLELAEKYGFGRNLWQDYLTFYMLTNENPLSLSCENAPAFDGSVNSFARSDFKIIKQLFDFDFSPIEEYLGTNCFTLVTHYDAAPVQKNEYDMRVGKAVREVSGLIDKAKDEYGVYDILTRFYREKGVGVFAFGKALCFSGGKLCPMVETDNILLEHLVGYSEQKEELIGNTEAFVRRLPANNVLLYGDSGTGKSTSIRALANMFFDRGLRLVEVYKHQLKDLSDIISKIKNRNYRFIIFMDDLSFEEYEVEYKFLKAAIEGGFETMPENVLIYATSNRRHIVREMWQDRSDMSAYEVHRSDTLQEKLSLFDRFGIAINFSKPTREEFFEIVLALAARHPEITLSDEEIIREAGVWEIYHGGVSGRSAQQFINYLAGKA